ncbi:hypothetical protein [Pseudarthrobacter sp. N5]|uniref:hypothetical protein n=1 Tax=Pseudarthrobacter sp. N5 TaxID=3418416 RepID=UPI003CF110AF
MKSVYSALYKYGTPPWAGGARDQLVHLVEGGHLFFQVLDGKFSSGRIYTEIVRDAGGIEAQIDRMAKGTP